MVTTPLRERMRAFCAPATIHLGPKRPTSTRSPTSLVTSVRLPINSAQHGNGVSDLVARTQAGFRV